MPIFHLGRFFRTINWLHIVQKCLGNNGDRKIQIKYVKLQSKFKTKPVRKMFILPNMNVLCDFRLLVAQASLLIQSYWRIMDAPTAPDLFPIFIRIIYIGLKVGVLVKINNACYTGALCLYIFVLLSMFLIVRPPHLLSIYVRGPL